MRLTGTQYSLEKKTDILELKKAGKVIETYTFKGRSIDELTDEIWNSLRRKGAPINKEILLEGLFGMFPGVRRHGPIK
ncbi:MAG: hypothetical protein ACTSYL_03875 [Candidatus Thorarchaeota archaeon]